MRGQLKFATYRNEYRRRMFEASRAYEVSMLAYCITSNHVHHLMRAETTGAVSGFMQEVQGDFAEWNNRHKRRSGPFWDGRYHCTMVESGIHLWNCLTYIDLNMVRAGVVGHPSRWDWCSYRELTGERKRYRLVDRQRLLELVEGGTFEEFQRDYTEALSEAAARGGLRREPKWTESIAVGSKEYVADVAGRIRARTKLYFAERGGGQWTVREPESSHVGTGAAGGDYDGASLIR